jgi:succinate dehydrogenase / fumarate reductase cytochrome b subunit
VLGSIIGKLVLLGYTWALIHHLLGGFRHFMWDLGHGFEKELSTKLAIANIIGSLCLTVLVWVIGFIIRF